MEETYAVPAYVSSFFIITEGREQRMKYFLGLDNGGTTTKAALYDRFGKELCVCSADTQVDTPFPGFCERDMEQMWQANCRVIRDVLEKTSVDPYEIAGIAVCGHGKGLYLWGKDGGPVRPGILSTDNRAWEYPVKWEQTGIGGKVFGKTCQRILACQAVSLLAWLKDHESECISKIQWVFECKDYIRFRLTGEARAERTDYSGANLMNLYTKGYDRDLMALFGLEEVFEMLPPLCNAGDICGTVSREAARVTGLAEGTPVAGGMFDVDACALATDTLTEDRLCMIAGTWSINEYIRKEPVLDGTVMLNSLFCDPNYFLVEESSATSAGNQAWMIRELYQERKREIGGGIYQEVDREVAKIPVQDFCPVFTPFLLGTNVHPNAKASFVGISGYHHREHLMRSVMEGITFSHRTHFDRLLRTRTRPFSCIRLAGGAAKSKIWAQMFADVMETPVETVDIGETGTLGCAVTVAVAAGVYSDFQQAASSMVHVKERFEPNPGTFDIYRKKYRMYRLVNESLDPVWTEMQEMIESGVRE